MTKQKFVRNWFQEDLFCKGITFARTNNKHSQGVGRLCLNCGTFHPGKHTDEDWTCTACQFQHQEST